MSRLIRNAGCVRGEEDGTVWWPFTGDCGKANQMTNLKYNEGEKVVEGVGSTSMHRAVERKERSLVFDSGRRGGLGEMDIDKEEREERKK